MDTDFSLPRAGPKGEDIFVHATLGVHGKQSVSAEVVLGYCSEDQIQAPGQPSKMNFEHHKVHMGVDGAPEHTWSKRDFTYAQVTENPILMRLARGIARSKLRRAAAVAREAVAHVDCAVTLAALAQVPQLRVKRTRSSAFGAWQKCDRESTLDPKSPRAVKEEALAQVPQPRVKRTRSAAFGAWQKCDRESTLDPKSPRAVKAQEDTNKSDGGKHRKMVHTVQEEAPPTVQEQAPSAVKLGPLEYKGMPASAVPRCSGAATTGPVPRAFVVPVAEAVPVPAVRTWAERAAPERRRIWSFEAITDVAPGVAPLPSPRQQRVC
uniref:Uncharacterized protein n=3 Tax=Phaeomonas parva TaxID=124430 RepID=A0A7S1XLS1_9STRA|mmetsp:Transcript_15835/g.48243  ORF Transcript_15835/g.48243 Transcript_15835/m.48243 type:complete len:322 (+) Transcript_15835:674-1639(+)